MLSRLALGSRACRNGISYAQRGRRAIAIHPLLEKKKRDVIMAQDTAERRRGYIHEIITQLENIRRDPETKLLNEKLVEINNKKEAELPAATSELAQPKILKLMVIQTMLCRAISKYEDWTTVGYLDGDHFMSLSTGVPQVGDRSRPSEDRACFIFTSTEEYKKWAENPKNKKMLDDYKQINNLPESTDLCFSISTPKLTDSIFSSAKRPIVPIIDGRVSTTLDPSSASEALLQPYFEQCLVTAKNKNLELDEKEASNFANLLHLMKFYSVSTIKDINDPTANSPDVFSDGMGNYFMPIFTDQTFTHLLNPSLPPMPEGHQRNIATMLGMHAIRVMEDCAKRNVWIGINPVDPTLANAVGISQMEDFLQFKLTPQDLMSIVNIYKRSNEGKEQQ